MRRLLLLTVLSATVLLLGVPAPAAVGQSPVYATHLSGSEEVPPNDSRAIGTTVFRLAPDGMSLDYRLIVANLHNVTQAHIHLGPAGTNGPVVVWLYPDAPPAELIPGRTSGILATGTITAADLVGQLAGQPIEALFDLIDAGNAYVNVHTSAFPPGEIRGQIH